MANGSGEKAPCSVWGRVVDKAGSGVPGAVVHWLDPREGDGPALPRIRYFPVATTDGNGRFWAVDLPPGPCVLVPDLDGVLIGQDGGRWESGTRLQLPIPREPEAQLRFPFVPMDFSRLQGNVLTPDKRIARGWHLALLDPDRPQPLRKGATDVEGTFEWTRLKPGSYLLVLNGSAEAMDGSMPVKLEGGKTLTANITLHARPPGPRHSARAVCFDENGIPLQGVQVGFAGRNFNAPPVTSGPDGVAVAAGLPVPAIGATGNLEGRFPAFGEVQTETGDMPEVHLILRSMHILRVEVFDAATNEPVPRYNVHVHHEAGMAGDESGPRPRGIRGRGVMDHGKLGVIPGPCKVLVEAPGYEGVEMEVEVPAEGLKGPLRVDLLRHSR